MSILSSNSEVTTGPRIYVNFLEDDGFSRFERLTWNHICGCEPMVGIFASYASPALENLSTNRFAEGNVLPKHHREAVPGFD